MSLLLLITAQQSTLCQSSQLSADSVFRRNFFQNLFDRNLQVIALITLAFLLDGPVGLRPPRCESDVLPTTEGRDAAALRYLLAGSAAFFTIGRPRTFGDDLKHRNTVERCKKHHTGHPQLLCTLYNRPTRWETSETVLATIQT